MFYDGLRRFEKHITNTEETEDEEETKKEPDKKKVIPVALGIATVLTISILFLSVAPPLSPYGTDSGKLAVTMHSDTPVSVSINVDGTTVVEETSNAIEIYEEIDVEPGQHAVSISAQGAGSNAGPYKYSDTISIGSGEFKMIDFNQKNGTFYTKNLKKVEKEHNPFKEW
ncbi:MAG: hypothetical protein GWO20_12190, partial [Candidatus Korarchaeota archaeon]|nr:hypothetical protein [Candidatus Korarchaeota archaeon]NIW13304.1 hypothetical protein [Candidatus Thorarchaeota archaeon]